MANNNNNVSYTAKDIYVLEGLEPVRKRPGMYIGSTGLDGLHHLIWEVFDNSRDEAMGGFADEVEVALLPDNRVRVADNGRGIPVEIHKQTKVSALETVMTTLHAGGKFGGESYKIAGGLHGVGVSVVNALSIWLKAEVHRDGGKFVQEYKRGKASAKVKKISSSKLNGTIVTFEPDPEVFKEIKFEWPRILSHLRQQAYLVKKLKIRIIDAREFREKIDDSGILFLHSLNLPLASETFYFEGGLLSLVKFLNRKEKLVNEKVFYAEKTAEGGIIVETAVQYIDDIDTKELSFANNINTPEGGMHLTGFRTALTRTLNDYARKNEFLKADGDNFTGEDVREGLTAVISVKLREPQFEGQTKAKLGNPEVRTAVETVFGEAFSAFLEENPNESRAIIEKTILSLKARKAAKAAKESILRKGVLEGLALPGKLADCQSRDPAESELFIVEGDSAGGCFSGDTKVALADGRNISFRELVEEDQRGKKNYCYTIDKDRNIEIAPIENPRKTKINTEVIKVILDNDEEIVCTPNHKFMLRDESYKEAKNLQSTDSLMPLRKQHSKLGKRITIKGYELVFSPWEHRWIFTHLLTDKHNLKNNVYEKESGDIIHHVDFNKLNNNPENLTRMSKLEHLLYHTKFLERTLHRPDVKEKCKKAHQLEEYRQKIKEIMTTPQMRKMLSERAKKQWQDEEYKNYMTKKFLEFYSSNIDYREKNSKILYENQKKYWENKENREKQAERVKNFFEKHPEKRSQLSEMAKKEWADLSLLNWRSETTKNQWTKEFRAKRKTAYDKTYLRKTIEVLYNVYQKNKTIDIKEYNQIRKSKNDKSLIRYETICQRFFNGNEKKLEEAVLNYNHRIKSIILLKEKIDVYDFEVKNNHNFALASGVFVHNSSKQGRDRRTQAILPLRGKILNIERVRIDKMLASKEIKALVIALGTAIAEEFDITKLRYHKIIIATDADVDGSHIRTLLLTLFYRHYLPVIEGGYLYIALPPLFRIQKGKEVIWAYSEEEKNKLVGAGDGYNIQRYKGLGEMNPEQLWETTIDPARRVLKQVTIDDAEEADKTFDMLMGKEVEPRKIFIQTHAAKVQNLDV